jgi:hypothetical protein
MADKLKAAEGALEEAKASLAAAEQCLEDEKSLQEARDKDIRKRLEALNTSLLSKYSWFFLWFFSSIPFFLLMQFNPCAGCTDHEKIDSTLDALKLLEGNRIYGRNVINNCRKVVARLDDHFFLTQELAEGYDRMELAKSFSGSVDPFINYRRSQRQSCVEVAMATLMQHGDPVDWKNVTSSYPKDATGKRVLLQYYLLGLRNTRVPLSP